MSHRPTAARRGKPFQNPLVFFFFSFRFSSFASALVGRGGFQIVPRFATYVYYNCRTAEVGRDNRLRVSLSRKFRAPTNENFEDPLILFESKRGCSYFDGTPTEARQPTPPRASAAPQTSPIAKNVLNQGVEEELFD